MDGSCGFVLQNEFWIGGGWGNDWSQEEMKGAKRRQEGILKPIVHSAIYNNLKIMEKLAKIQNCTLINQQDLPYDLRSGACNTFQFEDSEKAWLCFGQQFKQRCLS